MWTNATQFDWYIFCALQCVFFTLHFAVNVAFKGDCNRVMDMVLSCVKSTFWELSYFEQKLNI